MLTVHAKTVPTCVSTCITTCWFVYLQAIEKIITQVMNDVGKPLVDNVTEAIATTYNDLNIKLEETALPRPKQLGKDLFMPCFTLKSL